MTVRSRMIAAASLAIAATLALGACSTGAPAAPSASPQAPEAAADWWSADPATVTGTVSFWNWGDTSDVADQAITEFNKVYPNITVEAKTVSYKDYVASLSAALASGEGPDTFHVESAMAYQFADLLEDVTPLYEARLGAGWKDIVSGSAVGELTASDGRLLGAPNGISAAGTLQLNVGLLNELGLTFPEGQITPAQLAEFCGQVADKGKQCISMGAKDGWVSQDVFQAIASSVAPGKFWAAIEGGDWTDAGLVEALDIWKEMFTNGVFQDGALGMNLYTDAWYAWLQGKAVATPVGYWGATDFVAATNITNQGSAGVSDPTPLENILVPFPSLGSSPTTLAASISSGTAINADSENKAAAAVWTHWFSIDPNGYQKISAKSLAGLPSVKGVEIEPEGLAYPELVAEPLEKLVAAGLASTEPRAIPYPELVTALTTALQSSATGVDSAEVLKTLQAASDAIDRG